MKSLFTMILLICAFSVTPVKADICLNASISVDGVGNVTPSEGERCFEYVKAGAAHAIGTVVVYDASDEDGYTVTTSSTAGAKPKCMIVETCIADKQCKCQTSGYTELLLYSGQVNATAGDIMYVSEVDAGYASHNASAAVTDVSFGFIKEAKTATGAVKAVLKF